MHIRRFDRNYSRRKFMRQLVKGVLSTGVLLPLWPTLMNKGNTKDVYPDELNSIEEYTKGKLGVGDQINSGNVQYVKELLDPIQYQQVFAMGRELNIRKTTEEIYSLSPKAYLDATISNNDMATFSKDGNVVTKDGLSWIGGNPFPNPKNAKEIFAGMTLSWGRHDVSSYAIKEYDLNEFGDVAYQYQSAWIEMSPVGRLTLEPKPFIPGSENILRYQSLFFLSPNDIKGTSYLNIWPYDQNKYPDLYGYLPAFKRVRRFPTNQRFEPLIPGSTLYLSDAWAAGDPFLTWGNYKIVDRGPALAAVNGTWSSQHLNWEGETHGGENGETFWNTDVELVPEVIVVEAEPVGYPRAPVSKKRVWVDARTLLPLSMVSYDRKGEVYRSFDGAYSLYEDGNKKIMDGNSPYWSWTKIHAYDIQTNRMSRLEQVSEVDGGFKTKVNDPLAFDRYLTRSALRRFGH